MILRSGKHLCSGGSKDMRYSMLFIAAGLTIHLSLRLTLPGTRATSSRLSAVQYWARRG